MDFLNILQQNQTNLTFRLLITGCLLFHQYSVSLIFLSTPKKV